MTNFDEAYKNVREKLSVCNAIIYILENTNFRSLSDETKERLFDAAFKLDVKGIKRLIKGHGDLGLLTVEELKHKARIKSVPNWSRLTRAELLTELERRL